MAKLIGVKLPPPLAVGGGGKNVALEGRMAAARSLLLHLPAHIL
jgi:hypothetical protein